jgi:hypothetical protein
MLRAWPGVGGLEAWMAEEDWEPAPGGWKVISELQGGRFRIEVVGDELRLVGGPPGVVLAAEALGDGKAALRSDIVRFRAEEQEHRGIGSGHGAQRVPAYQLLSAASEPDRRAAIKASERI